MRLYRFLPNATSPGGIYAPATAPPDEMVERAAREIASDLRDDPEKWRMYRTTARTALVAALRQGGQAA